MIRAIDVSSNFRPNQPAFRLLRSSSRAIAGLWISWLKGRLRRRATGIGFVSYLRLSSFFCAADLILLRTLEVFHLEALLHEKAVLRKIFFIESLVRHRAEHLKAVIVRIAGW